MKSIAVAFIFVLGITNCFAKSLCPYDCSVKINGETILTAKDFITYGGYHISMDDACASYKKINGQNIRFDVVDYFGSTTRISILNERYDSISVLKREDIEGTHGVYNLNLEDLGIEFTCSK